MPTTLTAGTELELNQAIATVDGAASGAFVIQLTANIGLGTDTGQNITYNGMTIQAPAELYALNLKNGVTVTIDGQNHDIDGSIGGFSLFRGLFVYAGNVTVQNLTIQNTKAVGGDGFNGGGGGGGLGGGLYIANDVADGAASAGNVTLDNVTFTNNNATGGTTDFYQNVPTVVSGGGGGLGGQDGSGTAHAVGANGSAYQGGGGIGSTANGGNVQSGPGPGIVLGAASAGTGITNASRTPFPGGASGGGAGGTEGPGDSSYAGGGGGIGGKNATSLTQGGAGGYGGGGGEAAAGGFGGGGGSGGGDTGNAGGNGGFGGGGGGSKTKGGAGGFGAGDGSSTQEYTGGGGLGAGGAIFVQQGASLTYKGGSVSGGSVTGGGGATMGSAYGSGIFLQGNETIMFAPTLGETLTISSDITDQTSSGGTGANAGAGQIVISGAGVVKLTGNVHVAGGVSIGGTLAASALGSNTLTLNGGTILVDVGPYAIIPNAITVQSGGGTVDANGHTAFITGPLGGSGPLLLESTTGAGSIELQGDDHAYTGTVTVAQNVVLTDDDGANASPSGAALVLHGSLALVGLNESIGSLAGEGTVYNLGPSNVALTVGGDGTSTTFSGQFDDIEGATVALIKTGGGTFTLSGSSALAAGVTINGGTLAFSTAGTQTVTGAIGGSGALQKLGTGSLFLTGPNTYAGATTVTAGTLYDEGSSVSATTVQSGASLGGNGSVGAVTVQSGGTLLPGTTADANVVGTLRTGNLALKQGSKLAVTLNGTVLTSYDQVKVTGSVDITGATLALNSTNGFLDSITPGTSFTLIDNDGADAVTGMFANEDANNEVVIAPNAPLSSVTTAYLVNTHGGDGNDVVLTELNTQPNIYQVPGTQTVASGGTLAFTGAKSIQVADADQGQTITATVSVSHGTLSTSGSAAIHSGDGTATVTITGEAFAVSNTLQTLIYKSNAGFGGNDALSIKIKDNSGASNDTATAAVALSITGPYVEPFAASQVSVVINPNGSLTLTAPNATTTLSGVSTIKFNDATDTVSGNTLTQYSADGSVRVSTFNITGQAYTGTVYAYGTSGQLVAARYTGITGQTYQAYENDYSNGIFTGTQYFTTGITGQTYTSKTMQFNTVGQETAVLFGGVTGQAYSAYEFDYMFGLFSGSKFTYTTVPMGATYSSYEIDYTGSNTLAGSKYFTTNITGQSYTGQELDYDGNGHLSVIKLTGVTGQPYSSVEQDYSPAGIYTGYKAFYTNLTNIGLQEVDVSAVGVLQKIVDSGINNAAYTSAEQDYAGGVLSGQKFVFAVTGQPYAAKELDYDGNAHLIAIKLTGVTGQTYSSIEQDYNTAGVYTGYKAFYTNQPGIGQQEVDVSAAGQTQKIVDSGIANSAYSGLEQDFANGVYIGEKVFFTNVVNKPYTSYELDQNAAGANLDEILNNANGSHTILGLANNVTLQSIGNDTMTAAGVGGTGNGSGVTFAFTSLFGLDTITDFSGHLTGAGHDTISLPTSEFGTFATLVVNQNGSGNAVIGATGGDQLTLLGVTKAQVLANSGDFKFV